MSLIVILDDRVTNRNLFKRLAGSISDSVRTQGFGDPQQALEWLAANTPDLIITDYKMPGMDGAEFIRRFRKLDGAAEVPVIAITVYEERSFRMKALEAGATDFLLSPIDHQEFVTRARNLLKLRRQQQLLTKRARTLERRLERSERYREEALRDSSERLAQVIDTVPAMISATDGEGRLLFANAYHGSILGADPTDIVGSQVSTLLGEEGGARSTALDRKVFETCEALPSFEEEIVDRDGVRRILLTTKAPLTDINDLVVGVVTSSLDITDRKRAESHLVHLAHFDPLTDLPNRTLLRDRLRREIARSRRGDHAFALHLIDLDDFKGVNDVLGHSTGDEFLKVVGQRLLSVVRESDMVARLGGDEFAILQTGLARSEDAAELGARILSTVCEPHLFRGERLSSSASVGIAIHPADGADSDDILKNADLAMYRAKNDGGNLYRFYAADMDARARRSMALDAELRKALARDQFVLHYQPQVDMRTGMVIGAEALLRWQHPDGRLRGPGEFLARAEENGLIVPINEWVLREACREAASWHNMGLPPVRIAVNLSPVQFRKQNVPLLVAKVLGDTGLDASCLDLEITEGIVMGDSETVVDHLRQIRALGVGVSLDDFGTGFCSLSYVKRFPVDRLKIDQCFVRDLPGDPNDAAIVRAIVSLGHSLELLVVAEGVETADQLDMLRAEGCDEVQGYHLGRPQPAADFIDLVREAPILAKTG